MPLPQIRNVIGATDPPRRPLDHPSCSPSPRADAIHASDSPRTRPVGGLLLYGRELAGRGESLRRKRPAPVRFPAPLFLPLTLFSLLDPSRCPSYFSGYAASRHTGPTAGPVQTVGELQPTTPLQDSI